MTNRDKFIEIMNRTFNAGLTTENCQTDLSRAALSVCKGSPCGLLKAEACEHYVCSLCIGWWDQEYVEPA